MGILDDFEKQALANAYKSRLAELRYEINEIMQRVNELRIDIEIKDNSNRIVIGSMPAEVVGTKKKNNDFVFTRAILEVLKTSAEPLIMSEIRVKLREKHQEVETRFTENPEGLRKTISGTLSKLAKRNSNVKRIKKEGHYKYYYQK